MPIERRSSSAQIRSVLIALVSVTFIVMLGYAVFRAATGDGTSVTSGTGDGRWNAGAAASKAKLIAEGGPILIPDPAGAQRLPIYISHVGSDDGEGWYAFEARPDGTPDDCFISWDGDAEEFTASCDGTRYPPDGVGLRQFEATVTRDGDLVIDLTPGSRATTTAR